VTADPVLLALLAATVLGACFGSFLNVCVARWPAGLSVVRPPSRCPHCAHAIRWHENVPVLGWLRLGGKCAGCGTAISARYPLVEATVALLWAAAVAWAGPTFEAVRLAMFATIMLGVVLTDVEHYVIPDGFTVFGFLWVLATSVWQVVAAPEGASHFVAPVDAFVGACAAAGFVAIVGWLGEVALKKEAMGFGDVTLMAVVGAAIGPVPGIVTTFVAAGIGAVSFLCVVYPIGMLRAKRDGRDFEPPMVPFGVFLAPAAVVLLVAGPERLRELAVTLGLVAP
jgi:leader peptidase (prepilin peptidase)/N-methyltransferase